MDSSLDWCRSGCNSFEAFNDNAWREQNRRSKFCFLGFMFAAQSHLQESAQKGAFAGSKSGKTTSLIKWQWLASKPAQSIQTWCKQQWRILAKNPSQYLIQNYILYEFSSEHDMTLKLLDAFELCVGIQFTPRSYNHTFSWQPWNRNEEFTWFIYLEGTPSCVDTINQNWRHTISTYFHK